ncbi:MAG: hypothetical protein ACYCWE_13825 [Eubacteriales bacterium]
MRQILPDNHFKHGFTVLSQKDHAGGNRVAKLGEFVYSDQKPVWKLAQWDSGPCLWDNRIPSDQYILSDGISRFAVYNPVEESLKLRLDTSAFYKGRPAEAGMYWPHLLIEQNNFSADVGKQVIINGKIRLLEYNETPIDGDYVRAAQFLLFLYLRSKTGDDFVWFGLHFFDSRAAFSDQYIGYDGGKADASQALIYSLGERSIFSERSLWKDGAPCVSEEWLDFSADLRPHIDDMITYGIKDGYFKNVQTAEDFVVCGLNVGWESIATFDHTMEIKDLEIYM